MTSIVLAGVHEDAPPSTTTVRYVGATVTREFTNDPIRPQDLVKKMTAVCAATWAVGMTAVWSFKPRPDAVASGQWKPYVVALGNYLKANPDKKTIVVIWHEPENDIPEWFSQPEDFVSLFNTVAGWLESAYPQVVTCHAALGYRYADKVDITDKVAPRWRTKAKLHAVDVYSGRSFPLDTILPELSGFVRWRTHVARTDPYAVTERGWTVTSTAKRVGPTIADALRASTIRRETEWLLKNRPALYLVWSTEGAEKDPGLPLDPAGARAVADLIAALARPEGYEPGPVAGLLVHTASGLVVSAAHVGQHHTLYQTLVDALKR